MLIGFLLATPTRGAEPIERRPYTIRAWVVVDPAARIDARGREALIASWRTLTRRFVGAVWDLEVADGPGPLAVANLDDLRAEAFRPAVADRDKGWVLKVGPDRALSGREFDAATGLLGPPRRRVAPFPDDLTRDLFALALDVFAPLAEIGESSGGGVLVTVQGAALPSGHPSGRPASIGTVFRPVRLFQKPDGSLLRLEVIRASYLRVEGLDGPVARCAIYSAYRDPLSRRSAQKLRLLALGIRPTPVTTRLRFLAPGPGKPPAAGYTLMSRLLPDGALHEEGTTDREGRIVLSPGFTNGLVALRLVAAEGEPLAEFPLMPGESADEQTIVLADMRPLAVAAVTRLHALRDELIDLVARRKRLEKRLEARAAGERWDEVRDLLADYRRLPMKDSMREQLNKIEEEARRQQAAKQVVLTRSVQRLLADTRALIDTSLDDDLFSAYESAQREAASRAAAKPPTPTDRTAATGKVAPRGLAGSNPLPPPEEKPAAPAPSPTSKAPADPPKAPGGTPF